MNAALDAATAPPTLRPGSPWFRVDELPAYEPCGSGEHLYLHLEKTDLTTDQVVAMLAKWFGLPRHSVGVAGRKDRRAITSQWFSLHTTRDAPLTALAEQRNLRVLSVTRHRNKLRTGHLRGNRFTLGIDGVSALPALQARIQELSAQGIRNRFGPQRFGFQGATLRIALAWGLGDHATAVQWIVDAHGQWRIGEAIPDGFRDGPEGRVIAALRRGATPSAALRQGGDDYRKLVASAAQSAIFNAVLDARVERGLLHTLRVGDIACTDRGACFPVIEADLADLARRAAPGVLDVRATAPLPGAGGLMPSPERVAEERAWSAETGVAWEWFTAAPDQPFTSPGERRPLVIPFLEPVVATAAHDDQPTLLRFALPAGAYASEVLAQIGIAMPADRRG